jgi:spore maturation protein CgeB
MRIVLFTHSIVSDWNHGNAHFLRGVASELVHRGHEIRIFEPRESWSRAHLLEEQGQAALDAFHATYPDLSSSLYDPETLDLDAGLRGADLVIVHEWNSPRLVNRIGRHRRERGGYSLLFHDTHHRVITDPGAMKAYDLSHYDGALVFGESLRRRYVRQGLARRVWVWHEAADTRVFQPLPAPAFDGHLVWIGNWGDEERTAELREFFIDPVRKMGYRARAYGVRYPGPALESLQEAGIEYGGWTANFQTPSIYARYRFTLHIPRRPYTQALPGIPTIRVFEALACGIPLICSPWDDSEGLFTPGKDFLVARNGEEMTRCMAALASDEQLRAELARHGLNTIRARHTCRRRVDELLRIHQELIGASEETMEQRRAG